MIKIALKNIRFLEKISKITVLKYFFILKISVKFNEINSEPVLQKFYTDIYVSNQTSKRTLKNRFPDINELSLQLIKEQKKTVIHDVAVSNGISSNNFHKFLLKKKKKHEFYISDKFAEIKIKKGLITRAYDKENNLIFAYAVYFYAGDKNIFFLLMVLLYKILTKQKNTDDFDYKLLPLHPEILIKTKEINFINYDLFQTEINEKFTFVRVMIILNTGYFTEKQIKTGIENIIKSIKENGILLIGTTNSKNINNASFYKKINGQLAHFKDINKGSKIKQFIKNL